MKKIAMLGIATMLIAAPLAACDSGEEETVLRELPASSAPAENFEELFPALPDHPEEPAVPAGPARAEYIVVRANGLNIRSGAGTSYGSLGQVESDVLLHYDGTEGDWHRTYYRGKTAYVSAKEQYTSLAYLDEGEQKVERVIAEGVKVLGVPYVYGATRLHDGKGNMLKGFSTSKFDCSSLMQYIFYEGAGVLLDMNTRTQIKQGQAVKKSELQRGDLMFFTNASRKNNTGIERVGHVALYLGDNYILHTASDYAKIEQISSTRWSYFIEGRRFF